MRIYDSHLHMGYLSETQMVCPSEVYDFIRNHNVDGGAIMPMAKCGGYDDLVFHQKLYDTAFSLGFDLLLYVNHQVLSKLINGTFSVKRFCGMKIHPDAVPFTDDEIMRVAHVAMSNNIPLLIHTGSKDSCNSSRFEYVINKYPKQIFVLCHARPAVEAFYLMEKYMNVWIDTSFLPFDDLSRHLAGDNVDRILFGSDFPANRWYKEIGDEDEWYEKEIKNIRDLLSEMIANKILYQNYIKLFKNLNLTI